jgi:thiol:disulfide interchange protein
MHLFSAFRSWKWAALITAACTFVGAPALTHAQGAADHVSWSAEIVPEAVAPGQGATYTVRARIGEGWKMYAMDSPPPSRGVSIEIDEAEGLEVSADVRQSPPSRGYDPNFQKDVTYFEREASFTTTILASADAGTGSREIEGRAGFMICNDMVCLPPTRVPFSAILRVVAAESASTIAPEAPATDPADVRMVPGPGESGSVPLNEGVQDLVDVPAAYPEARLAERPDDLDSARAGGMWAFVLLAIGAGLAALLTPCVFPMIPLTVSYFTKHSHDRREAVRMAAVYGTAIVLTFTGLGVLMAVLVGAAGAQSIANPWVNLFIGAVFILFAFSLLGLFELRLPNGLINFFNRQSDKRAGYTGVLFMGLTLTLVSFSCTAPFVGGLLAATAYGEWSYPVLGMVVFSATFALPFVVFALFPKGLSSLPASGSWMNAVKVVLGFVELAAALKFLSNADLIWGWNVISRPVAIALTSVILFMAGLYLLGKLRLAHEPAVAEIGVGRLMCSIAFFGGSLYLLPGLFGAPLNSLDAYLPPRQASDVSLSALVVGSPESHGKENWFTDDVEAAYAQAVAEKKPLFIDFTGYTCTNCREMEANVFTRPEVARIFERDFVLLRLFTDGRELGPEFQRYQLRLTGTVALPTYVIVDPHDRKVIGRHTGMAPASAFVRFLEEGASSFVNRTLASM